MLSSMGAKSRTFVDLTTGDYFDLYTPTADEQTKRRRSPFGKRWCKMAFEANIQLAKMDGIYTNDFRVFHLILPTIHEGDLVYINQSQMARELGMVPSVVSRSIRKLIEKRILERVDSASGRVYRLSPEFAWYGPDNGRHGKAIKDWRKKALIQ